MKYMNNGGFHRHPMMRTTLMLTMLFLAGFVVVNFLLFLSKMDLTPSSVAAYYLGNEEEFRPARSYQSMLELTHMHLPMMAVVILLLTHLVIFTPLTPARKYLVITIAFLSAVLNEGSNYLIRFVDAGFAWLKIAAFLTLQTSLTMLMAVLVIFLIRARQQQRQELQEEMIELQ